MKAISLIYLSVFLVFNLAIELASFGQSQRLVLVEEFTNAGCPPCAEYNPGFNKLLNANPSKVVAVKYQTNSPGYDVMNSHNSSQVATRDIYYNVQYVPWGYEDGNAWNGDVANYSQSLLNNRYAVTSPFTINVTHKLSPARDSIYAHVVITATGAVTGTLVAHVAVIERNIYFTTAPGTNGETHFEGVMVKMLPSDQGTTLATSWSVGNTKTIDASWKLANIYDTNQLAVVSWVQDKSTKQVHQAGYSRSHMANDAGITAVTGLKALICVSDVNPIVTLHNYTQYPLTSAIINYTVDGGAPQPYTWSGTLASDASITVALPTISLADGYHTIKFYTSLPNGSLDLDTHNDATTKYIGVVSTPVSAPLTQDFVATTFPPSKWSIEDPNGDGIKWVRSATGLSTLGSAKIDCYDSPSGYLDNLYTPRINFTGAATGSKLEFDLAHAQCTNAQIERLRVDVSTNCGTSWITVYNKYDPNLATVPLNSNCPLFTPSSSSTQWRRESVSLDQFISYSDIIIRFQAVSDQGNNIFIDNVNVTNGTNGINDILSDNKISLYPNPTTGEIFLNINTGNARDMTVAVSNMLGSVIKTSTIKDAHGLYPFDLTGQPDGNYFISIKTDKEVVTKRFFISK